MLNSPTGAWQPFTMRIDAAPFDDVQGAPGDPADRRPQADGPAGAERLRQRRERPLRALRPGLREATCRSASRTSSRPSRCSSRPARRTSPSSSSPPPVFQGIVEAAQVFAEQAKGAGVNGQGAQGRHRHVLRRQLPQVAVRPGLLGVARLPRAGGAGRPAQLAVQRDPLGQGPSSSRLINQARGEVDDAKRKDILHQAQQMQYDAGRLHHPVLLEHHRRVQLEGERLRRRRSRASRSATTG